MNPRDRVLEPLEWDGTLNVRDLGGLPLREGGATLPRRLIRSDSPHALTDAGLAALAAYGVRVAVDLRADSERVQFPSRLEQLPGVTCVSAPIFTDEDPAPTSARTATDVYCWWVSNHRNRVASALAAVADAEAAPVLIHCHAGKDRTGLVVALLLRLAGVPEDIVAMDYAHSSLGLRGIMEAERQRRLARGDEPEAVERAVTLRERTMLETLRYVDAEHGGVGAYVESLELGASRLRRLTGLLRRETWPSG